MSEENHWRPPPAPPPEPSTPEPLPKPDWDRWAQEKFAPFHKAVLLSLDVDPECDALYRHDAEDGTYWFRAPKYLPEFNLREARMRLGVVQLHDFEFDFNFEDRIVEYPDGLKSKQAVSLGPPLADFAAFAARQGWTLPPRFPRAPAVGGAEVGPSGLDLTDLKQKLAAVGFGYVSPGMIAALDACYKYWRNYDPNDGSTAEKNEKVWKYLNERHDIPVSTGKVLASLLRDPKAPMGRRPDDETA